MSQVTATTMQAVKQDFCRRVMTKFCNCINNQFLLVNTDETAIFLNCSTKTTINLRGERIIAILVGGTSSMRFTLAVSVAMDGTELSLFLIFKGKPGGGIVKSLPALFPNAVYGCVQKKG